jgi:hypothetical protein
MKQQTHNWCAFVLLKKQWGGHQRLSDRQKMRQARFVSRQQCENAKAQKSSMKIASKQLGTIWSNWLDSNQSHSPGVRFSHRTPAECL